MKPLTQQDVKKVGDYNLEDSEIKVVEVARLREVVAGLRKKITKDYGVIEGVINDDINQAFEALWEDE